MKISIMLLLSFVILVLLSCGKSDEQIALEERHKQDSINLLLEKTKREAIESERMRYEEEQRKLQDKKQKEIELIKYQNSPDGIKENEEHNAKKFITMTREWNDPILGKDRIKLTIYNKAKYAIYKELVFQVKIYSRTETILAKKSFTLYDYILPDEKMVTYLNYGNMPSSGSRFSVDIQNFKTSTIEEARRNKAKKN
jgi:hypothetical protein